jgi:hypothetical protein
MNCDFCDGSGKVWRLRESRTVVDRVTCPKCIRGITVLGTHEMLRDPQGVIHYPGEAIGGTIKSGLISTSVAVTAHNERDSLD